MDIFFKMIIYTFQVMSWYYDQVLLSRYCTEVHVHHSDITTGCNRVWDQNSWNICIIYWYLGCGNHQTGVTWAQQAGKLSALWLGTENNGIYYDRNWFRLTKYDEMSDQFFSEKSKVSFIYLHETSTSIWRKSNCN